MVNRTHSLFDRSDVHTLSIYLLPLDLFKNLLLAHANTEQQPCLTAPIAAEQTAAEMICLPGAAEWM